LDLKYVPETATVVTGRVTTWTLTARNLGVAALPLTVTLGVPFEQQVLTESLHANTGAVITANDRLQWLGMLGMSETLTVTYQVTAAWTLSPLKLYGSASVATDQAVWQAGSYWWVTPFRAYLPVVRK
jgi:hypothetical protein